jgi:hypothetical protein
MHPSTLFVVGYCFLVSIQRYTHAFTSPLTYRRSIGSGSAPALVRAAGVKNDADEVVAATTTSASNTTPASSTPPVVAAVPVLNGKRVLPYKIIMTGLQDHRLAAVVCVMNSSYQRNTDGWNAAIYIGVTQNLKETLQQLHDQDATELRVAHVRALSSVYPQPNAMQDVADDWRRQAIAAGAKLDDVWAGDVLKYLFDDDDDDAEGDEDDDEESMAMMAAAMSTMRSSSSSSSGDDDSGSTRTIVSPFADNAKVGTMASNVDSTSNLAFTRESVDTVLNEVREFARKIIRNPIAAVVVCRRLTCVVVAVSLLLSCFLKQKYYRTVLDCRRWECFG